MQNRLSKRWRVCPPVSPQISQALQDYPPVLQQLLYNRGHSDAVTAQHYLSASGYNADPFMLIGMKAAVERLLSAIDRGERIAVYGDYDVDGVTATVLLSQVLTALGGNAIPYIPNRFEEGYGLNNDALDKLIEEDGVKVVVTVDCGVRSSAEVEHACQAGLDVIVSDHHSPLGDLPPALAVICQRQEGDEYPDKNLAGVGLAYKMAQALFSQRPVQDVQAEDWLDLVALGTVADVVPLTGENRMLVRGGLEKIRRGKRCGLNSLAGVASLSVDRCTAGEIGYMLGPRLNASGRIESALLSVNLLMSQDPLQASSLAQRLDDQNRKRQDLTRSMQARAEEMMQAAEQDHILFAFDHAFSSGVVGLVAARLTETYYRPSVVGYVDEETGTTRASCRSIDEFHITHALDQCADLLVRHGGHAKAAGFTVRNELRDELVSRLRTIAAQELGQQELRPVLRADMEISLSDLHPRILEQLDLLEPTGMDNPEAVFVSRNLRVVRWKPVGAEANHLRLTVSDGRVTYDGIAFRQGHWASKMPDYVDVLYTYERNYFRDQITLQLNIRDLRPSGTID